MEIHACFPRNELYQYDRGYDEEQKQFQRRCDPAGEPAHEQPGGQNHQQRNHAVPPALGRAEQSVHADRIRSVRIERALAARERTLLDVEVFMPTGTGSRAGALPA